MKDDDANKYQAEIDQKCPHCFRKDECMLLPSQRATLCLGPFKDEEDRTRKLEEDWAKEEDAKRKERESGLRKYQRKQQIEEYRINRMLADLLSGKEEEEDDGD